MKFIFGEKVTLMPRPGSFFYNPNRKYKYRVEGDQFTGVVYAENSLQAYERAKKLVKGKVIKQIYSDEETLYCE